MAIATSTMAVINAMPRWVERRHAPSMRCAALTVPRPATSISRTINPQSSSCSVTSTAIGRERSSTACAAPAIAPHQATAFASYAQRP